MELDDIQNEGVHKQLIKWVKELHVDGSYLMREFEKNLDLLKHNFTDMEQKKMEEYALMMLKAKLMTRCC